MVPYRAADAAGTAFGDEIAARIAQLRTRSPEKAPLRRGESGRESIVEGLEAMLGHAVHRRETTAVAVLTACLEMSVL